MFQSKLNISSLRPALLLGAATAAALSVAGPANAVETVVVTGSRIPQQGLYSSSPVSVIGTQEFNIQGTTNLGDLIRSMPASANDGDGTYVDNGSDGSTTIDLYGLGDQRTLVLVDGKRVMPESIFGAVDLNQFPSAMIDHVEILTGGASSVYGGDAVSGVINIITRKDFEGVEASGLYSVTNHSDGQQYDASLVMGSSSADGKGNITLYANYTNKDPVFQRNRGYSVYALSDENYDGCPGPNIYHGFCAGGSGGIPEGRVTSFGGPSNPGLPTGGGLMFTNSRTLVPYDGREFNFDTYQYQAVPNTRYALGANGHYEINKAVDVYTRITFADDFNTQQLAPTPIQYTFNVNCGNPNLSSQERSILFGQSTCTGSLNDNTQQSFIYRERLVSNGGRITTDEHSSYQIVLGVRGDLGGSWTYDISGQYGRTLLSETLKGDASAVRFQQGLLVNPDSTCVDPSNGCVPIDIFATGYGVSQAAVDFYTLGLVDVTTTQQWDAQANLTGDLGEWGIQSPWAKNPVAVSGGLEYRQEKANFTPDDNLATNNLLGFEGEPAVHGGFNTKEAYVETKIPLMEDQPFAELVEIDGGYRYASYNTAGVATSYKYAAIWQPVDDIRFRASVNRAVRDPDINELFNPGGNGAFSGSDPCGANATGYNYVPSQALCEGTGVLPGQYLTSALDCQGQCQARQGGNPSLKPEVGNTKSIGIVFTPTFLDGFTATIDYFYIKIKGAIFAPSFDTVMNECYSPAANPGADPNIPACQTLIHRYNGGFIDSRGYAVLNNQNIGKLTARGFNFEAHYTNDLDTLGLEGAGSFALSLVGAWNMQQVVDIPGSGSNNCAGYFDDGTFNCGAPEPRWRHTFTATWNSPWDFSITADWRYIESVRFDYVVHGYYPSNGAMARLPSMNYFDLQGQWNVMDHVSIYGGIRNLFDKNPPLVTWDLGGVANGNTFPGTYDSLGRIMFIGANVKF